MSRFRQRVLFPILATALTIGSILLLGEVLVRIFIPAVYWSFRIAADDWQVDREIGWIQKPNLNAASYYAEYRWKVEFQTNPDGLLPRDARRAKTPGLIRVMLFGDSSVVGRAVPAPERLHVKLQKQLEALGVRAEVLNAGVQGYSTDQELLLAKRLLPLYRPDIVLLQVCNNDFAANVSPTAFGISKPLFTLRDHRTLTMIEPDPKFLKIQKLEGLLQVVEYSALYRVFRPAILRLRLTLPPGSRRRLFTNDEAYFFDPVIFKSIDFDLFTALVLELERSARTANAAFWLWSHPHVGEVWDPYIAMTKEKYDRYTVDRKLKAIAATHSLDFCPVVDYFIQNQARGPFHLLPRDPHCNPTGYQLEAEVLSNCIRSRMESTMKAIGLGE